jgi:hypothetical protein
LSHWYERYDPDLDVLQLPATREEIETLAQATGADIDHLLEASSASDAPDVALLPEIRALRRLWQQEFAARNRKDTHDATIGI